MIPELQALRATIEDALNHHLPNSSTIAQPVLDAMRYATLGGGKRIRPMLVCATCTGLGGALEDALAPACAVEFIHAYSLVHDDLPAMDDDDLRHGLPSNHIKFGEATAVLAGDALQALAFETVAKAPTSSDAVRLRGVQLLAEAVGWRGMVGGQSYDLESERKQLSLSELQTLHAAKTGALIKVAVQLGALFGRPKLAPETYVLITEFASRVGLAFQVIDDVLDVTGSTEELGKPAGSDAGAGKSTYPALLGVDAARDMARELLEEALPMLDRAGLQHNQLQQLAELAVKRDF
ncbi:MAG: polyprenyl synthetase family protein [Gammaproteobacteria bacterium]|nr:polyprenyl synthetase family protein [Gammaproteobacteria bacterium]